MLAPSIFSNNFMDDFFRDAFGDFGRMPHASMNSLMNTDVKEFDDKYEMALELPGYKKEDIQAELKDGYLYIQAKHNEEKDVKDDNGRFIHKERFTGKCQRTFYVGEHVKQEDILASFENGILNLQIPKAASVPEVEERKYIAIQ